MESPSREALCLMRVRQLRPHEQKTRVHMAPPMFSMHTHLTRFCGCNVAFASYNAARFTYTLGINHTARNPHAWRTIQILRLRTHSHGQTNHEEHGNTYGFARADASANNMIITDMASIDKP